MQCVFYINAHIDGAFVASSGKNMGAFKGVGYPEEIGEYYRIDEYKAWLWTAHGRFPTNTPGWWGGAHPFTLLNWSIVHNGEISSYDTNRRYVEQFGYDCALQTDTEVITYLFDLLVRRHGFSQEMAAHIMAAPSWDAIDRMPPEQVEFETALRCVYSDALVNGPFSVILGSEEGLLALNDRLKLRALMVGEKDSMVYWPVSRRPSSLCVPMSRMCALSKAACRSWCNSMRSRVPNRTPLRKTSPTSTSKRASLERRPKPCSISRIRAIRSSAIPASAFNAACARVSALTRCIWSIPTWAVWSPITRSA